MFVNSDKYRFAQLFLDALLFSLIVVFTEQFKKMDNNVNPQEIKAEIAVLEMEIGFLSAARRSPNPMHSVVAGRVEIRRMAELQTLKQCLSTMEEAA